MQIIKRKKNSWKEKNRISFSQKKIKINKKKNKIPFLFFLLTLAIVLIYFFAFSAFFKINQITISGVEEIEKENLKNFITEQIKQKNKYYISRENFYFIDQGEIERALVENFPQINSVQIRKSIPNKLFINIEKKESALIWCRNDCFFVNMQGVAFMEADENQLIAEKRSFIKITEEADIKEESIESLEKDEEENYNNNNENLQEIEEKEEVQFLSEININDQVSDENFVQFAIDINKKISYNSKLKIKFYKTRGISSRELIAFTDKNTRIYFDTTRDAETQAKNLEYLTYKELEQNEIDNLEYIYLKNQDRIFYK